MKKLIIILVLAITFNLKAFANEIPKEILSLKSPDSFVAVFETIKGDFEVKIERKYSPLAVDRFYQLIEANYFRDIFFYRCVPNFVVQFGTLNEHLDSMWSKHVLVDEPVKFSNDTATIAFARAGKDTRGTQLFINIKNNSRLDTVTYGGTLGFPAFGKVIKGFDVILKLNFEYGDAPRKLLEGVNQDAEKIIRENYPQLDLIKRVYIRKFSK